MVPVCVNLSVHLCVCVCVCVYLFALFRLCLFLCSSVYACAYLSVHEYHHKTSKYSKHQIKSNQIKSQPHTAYGTLYESSIAYGIRKALMAQQKLTELDSKLRLLASSKVRNQSTVGKGEVKVWNNEMVIVR